MNRLDKVVVFRTLNGEDLRKILDIELNEVQNRIMASQINRQFIFRCTHESKEFLLREGTDLKYGARHLKTSDRAPSGVSAFEPDCDRTDQSGRRHQGGSEPCDGDKLTFSRERVDAEFRPWKPPASSDSANRKANKVGARVGCSRGASCGSGPDSESGNLLKTKPASGLEPLAC